MADDMANNIEFREPPKRKGGPGAPPKWFGLLAPLLEHPGRWAVVARFEDKKKAQTARGALRSRRYKFPPGYWEFVSRGSEVFARYLGPESDQ